MGVPYAELGYTWIERSRLDAFLFVGFVMVFNCFVNAIIYLVVKVVEVATTCRSRVGYRLANMVNYCWRFDLFFHFEW